MFGIPFEKPHAYLREYLTVLRQLLWDGQADFAGEFFHVHNAALPAGTTPPKSLASTVACFTWPSLTTIEASPWG